MQKFDWVIIGGGVIGLATARYIRRVEPESSILILEKEREIGLHASGRNSGVLHAGLYYPPDSLKSRLCITGRDAFNAYCSQHGLSLNRCGKLILATNDQELRQLEALKSNGDSKQIPLEWLDWQQMREIEPSANINARALYSPLTATFDPMEILARLQAELVDNRVHIAFEQKITKMDHDHIELSQQSISYGRLINTAGAFADQIAKGFGLAKNYRLLPFLGTYWQLKTSSAIQIRGNVYPTPNASLPFLGVHITRGADDKVYVGPTIIPTWGRENYHGGEGATVGGVTSILAACSRMYAKDSGGFRSMAMNSLATRKKQGLCEQARRLVPNLELEDLIPTTKRGIRPQLYDTRSGQFVMDFHIEHSGRTTHVLNAISPAFSSCFSFGEFLYRSITESSTGVS